AHVLPPRVEPVNAFGIFERSVEGEVEPELSRILDQDQASTKKEIGQPAETAGEGTQDSLSTNVAKSADEASVISRSEIERQWKAALDSSEQSYEDDIEDLRDAHAAEVGEFRETIAKLEAEVQNARKRKGTVQSIAHKTSKKLAAQGNELKTAKNELAAKDDELAYIEGILNAALVESESRDAMLNAALMESKSKDAMLQENATKIRRLEQWSKYQRDVYSELKIEHTEAQEGVVRPLQQEVARLTSLNRGYEDRNSAHVSQIAVLQNQLRWVPRLPRLQAQLAQACNERDAAKAEFEEMKFELAHKYDELQEEKDALLEQKLNGTAATEENTAATKVVTDQARTLSDVATYLCGSLPEAWFEEDQANGQKSAERVQVDNERQNVLVDIQAFLPRMHDNLPPEEGHGTTQAEQDHNDQPTAFQDAHENPCLIGGFAKGECLYCNEATSSQCPYCDKTAPGDTPDEPGQTLRVDHPKDQSSIQQGKPIETDQVKEVEAVVWQSTENAYGSANNAANNLQVALFNASPGAAPNQDTAEVEAEVISPEVLNLQLQHLTATLGLVAVHPAYVEFGHVYEYAQDFAQAQAYADGSGHRHFQETMPAHDDQSEDFDRVDFGQSDDDGSKGENGSHTPPPFEIYEDPIAGDDDGVALDPPSNGNGGAEAASSRFDFNIFEDPIADTNDEGDPLQRLNFSGGVEDGYDSSASYIPENSIDDTLECDYGLQPSPLRPGRQRSGIAFQ
ncbi:MAG: hypothetical protein LQ338_003987, partial [Usnochroma carphineum]